MSPNTKKLISALGAAVLAAVISFAAKSLVPIAPAMMQPILTALLVAVAHYVDTWDSARAIKAAKISSMLICGSLALSSATACTGAQLDANLQKVKTCADDARVDACIVSAATGAPEPETALACVQLCLADPRAKAYKITPRE